MQSPLHQLPFALHEALFTRVGFQHTLIQSYILSSFYLHFLSFHVSPTLPNAHASLSAVPLGIGTALPNARNMGRVL